jgi:gas vesicle protein
MKGFLFGLGIGVGLGILFAPMSGDETRTNISQRMGDLTDQAREKFEEGRDRVREKFEEGRDRVRSGISAIRSGAQAVAEQRPTGTESGNI